ncbi:hypothetical protein F5B19DRAFT_425112 [Rostrohypoxylon terebratum]|nr:hypothetical protein F5B19DRAFT_425112 [Rostrohypoxylon terebratum]
MVRLSVPIKHPPASYWPLVEIPKPPEPGHLHNRLPILTPPPRPKETPVALRVYRFSRNVALRRLIRYPTNLTSRRISERRQRFKYAGMNDIIEIGGLKAQKELLDELERRLHRRLDIIRQLADSVNVSNDRFSAVQGSKIMYDIASHHIYFMIEADLLPIHPLDGVIRASSVEEWLFGEKITIGHVPRILRHFNQRPSTDFEEYMRFYDAGIPPPYVESYPYSDPLFILKSYIWMLHKLAGGANHFNFNNFDLADSGYATSHGILNIFVALMDGHNCPVCHCPTLSHIRERFPQLSTEFVDIFLAVSVTHSYFQANIPAWPPAQSIPIDDFLR